MQRLRFTTMINAPVQRCFLLSLSVDLELDASQQLGLRAVGGTSFGILTEGQTVTWSARHLGLELRHKSVINGWRPFTYFRDSMVEGSLSFFEHEHHFASMNGGTRMRDEIRFAAPMGVLGRLAESLFVRRYLKNLMLSRNRLIRSAAESDVWHRYLDGHPAPEAAPVRREPAPPQVFRVPS